ncbi:unnamed protein product [Rhodiola kirilowii]
MVRAPCCEKMGLKRGPWTAEEDQVLINFISLYGHGNWRALPKQAGLLRCGKSCRLRWTNYLRPDIKRGNFTREEEDVIINLHQMLGNRWSAIAARLPGRTDNEIKNVWHTHLKKRLLLNKDQQRPILTKDDMFEKPKPQPVTISNTTTSRGDDSTSTCSPLLSSSSTDDISSSSSSNVVDNVVINVFATSLDSSNDDEFLKIDESFWSDVLPALPLSPLSAGLGYGGDHNEMMFWYEMFNRSGDMFVPEML